MFTSEVNFTNMFTQSFYLRRSPKCKKTVKYSVSFALCGSSSVKALSKTLTPGLNFINVLRTAFTLVYPKRVKVTDDLTVFFTLLGSTMVKAVRRTLMKSTPDIVANQNRKSETRVENQEIFEFILIV